MKGEKIGERRGNSLRRFLEDPKSWKTPSRPCRVEIQGFCLLLQSGFDGLPVWIFECEGKRGFVEVNPFALIGFFSIGAVLTIWPFLSSCPRDGLNGTGSNSLRRSCCGHMGVFQKEVLEMG